MPLQEMHCKNASKEEAPMQVEEACEMLRALPDWQLSTDGNSILRRYSFKNYKEAYDFVTKVSGIAEAQNHHPDIRFGWGYAEICFTTHTTGGLHMNDFVMAARVNELL